VIRTDVFNVSAPVAPWDGGRTAKDAKSAKVDTENPESRIQKAEFGVQADGRGRTTAKDAKCAKVRVPGLRIARSAKRAGFAAKSRPRRWTVTSTERMWSMAFDESLGRLVKQVCISHGVSIIALGTYRSFALQGQTGTLPYLLIG